MRPSPHHEREARRRYDALAVDYDRRWPRYLDATIGETLRRLDATGARAALDVGCGTGVLLERIGRAWPGLRLAGVDLSPGMLGAARRRLGSRAALVTGTADRLPFREDAFDLVVSTSALHHWPDPVAAIGEMRRVLRPAGRAAITDRCADRWLDRLRDRLLRRTESAHHRSLRSVELAALLADAGFADVRVERWRIGFRWGMMTATAVALGGSEAPSSSAAP